MRLSHPLSTVCQMSDCLSDIMTVIVFIPFFQGGSGNVDSSLLNEIRSEDFIPYKHLKKHKPKVLTNRISEAHANVCHLAALEAKLKYIQVSVTSKCGTELLLFEWGFGF